MKKNDQLRVKRAPQLFKASCYRRGSIGTGMLASPLAATAARIPSIDTSDADEWFTKIKGKHRMVFDVTQPHEILPFAWPKIFMMTNAATGTPANDCSAVVIFRHNAIPYAYGKRSLGKI